MTRPSANGPFFSSPIPFPARLTPANVPCSRPPLGFAFAKSSGMEKEGPLADDCFPSGKRQNRESKLEVKMRLSKV